MTAITTNITIIVGIPKITPFPRKLNEGGTFLNDCGDPRVTTIASPRAIDIVPKVQIIGEILVLLITIPFINPNIRLTANATRQAVKIFIPAIYNTPVIAPDTPSTAPTERSIPPDASTIVIPIAIIPSAQRPIIVGRILLHVKKWGERNAISILNIKIIMITEAARNCKSFFNIFSCLLLSPDLMPT
ncbi:hypothetical protein FACS189468_4340 [Spirochaetia bacterium]|nr:hypothetical protein FACS189468_4340 [Spirochaetia bacterium]